MPRKQILALFSFLFLSFIFSNNPLSAADGQKLFKQNCAVCHSLGSNKILGPGLEGVYDRVPAPQDQWLHKWIKNNEALVKSGDAYAKKISAFDASQMAVYEGILTDEEIDAIVAYLKDPKAGTAAAPVASAGGSDAPASAEYTKGEKIFKQNCAVCHSLGSNKVLGPGLQGVYDRVPTPHADWLHKWIKNNDKLIKSGDAYAKKISEFDASQMTVYEGILSDEDIDNVILYLKDYKPKAAVVATDVTTTAEGGEEAKTEETTNPVAILLGLIGLLMVLIFILRSVRFSLQNLQNEKSGLPKEDAVSTWRALLNWINANKRLTTLLILIFVGGALTTGWYALKDIGVYTGYHPEQPILFSHKIHAGDNAINCQYCHNGAERGRTAGIPSVNVCMNCHRGISTGPNIGDVQGKDEIAKIYAAAGWDPDKGEYNKPSKPIEWVKVHNLPDFVFFSHQQHVKVGKQECETCHGEVKKMNTIQQAQPLTMAWCIDCHRKTEVPGMKDNPYYESLHKKLAEKYKGQPITVAKMGGIECAKCHY